MNIKKLYKTACAFNRKKYRRVLKALIKAWDKDLSEAAKKGSYQLIWTTDEDRNDQHYLNIIAFRWLMRYGKNKPKLKDQRINRYKGKRYVERMQIIFCWDLGDKLIKSCIRPVEKVD